MRRQRIPLPQMQWRLVGAFTLLAGITLLVQYALFSSSLAGMVSDLPPGSSFAVTALPGRLVVILCISLGILLPLSAALGILTTFRWAGPLHRFHVHLRQVARGERPGPCRIREGDEFQELCALINSAVERARQEGPVDGRLGPDPDEDARRAA